MSLTLTRSSFKDKRENKRLLTPYVCVECEKVAKLGWAELGSRLPGASPKSRNGKSWRSSTSFRWLFVLGVKDFGYGRGWKVSPNQGATKWDVYRPNRRVRNHSPMCPIHCTGVCVMHISKIRQIISDLKHLCVHRMWKRGKVRVSKIGP